LYLQRLAALDFRVRVGAAAPASVRRIAGAWKIADRKVILDQNVLLAKNVSIFF